MGAAASASPMPERTNAEEASVLFWRVVYDTVNVRRAPMLSSDKLSVKSMGTVIEVAQLYEGWVKLVEHFDRKTARLQTGWMLVADEHKTLLAPYEPTHGVLWRVVYPVVNIRRTPSVNGAIVGTRDQGTVVEVIEESDGWVRVAETFAGGAGWMLIYSTELSQTLLEPTCKATAASGEGAPFPRCVDAPDGCSHRETGHAPTNEPEPEHAPVRELTYPFAVQSYSSTPKRGAPAASELGATRACAPLWRVIYKHNVNVRRSPDLTAQVVGSKKRGDVMGAIEEKNGWLRLVERFSGGDGWVLIHSPQVGALLEETGGPGDGYL